MSGLPRIPVLNVSAVEEMHSPARCPCTPPPQQSPLPKTPRPAKFFSPPRTPVSRQPQSFPHIEVHPSEDDGMLKPSDVPNIPRPDSACSNYSATSDSSMDSMTTFTTMGGSCTSPDSEEYFISSSSSLKEFSQIEPVEMEEEDSHAKHTHDESNRVRTGMWTQEMDVHLWRAYVLYQQNPKITPFYVLPGQVPPLGVCIKVAREAKRSWKEGRVDRAWTTSLNTPKRKPRTGGVTSRTEVGSAKRADIMRQAMPLSWPASEASTRRRLRALCRRNCSPSHSLYRDGHPKRRVLATPSNMLSSRASTISPSPAHSAYLDPRTPHDTFLFSTRGMALSLATSTASSMRPNGPLASIAKDDKACGEKEDSCDVGTPRASALNKTSFNGEISKFKLQETPEGSARSRATAVEGASRSIAIPNVPPSTPPTDNSRTSTHPPGLMSPLELKSPSSPFGTWPRQLRRQQRGEEDEESQLPPTRRPRRGTVGELFGEPLPTVTPVTNARRSRGYTVGSSNVSAIHTRRRPRPSAPLLTVTGPVSYDSPGPAEMSSPLGSRELFSGFLGVDLETPKRLGSPFEEFGADRKGKGKDTEGKSNMNSWEESVSALYKCSTSSFALFSARPGNGEEGGRMAKRAR